MKTGIVIDGKIRFNGWSGDGKTALCEVIDRNGKRISARHCSKGETEAFKNLIGRDESTKILTAGPPSVGGSEDDDSSNVYSLFAPSSRSGRGGQRSLREQGQCLVIDVVDFIQQAGRRAIPKEAWA